MLFACRGLGLALRSESYDTASIQRSDSVRVSTQLATACGWFESNGTSIQRSESEIPLIPCVRLEPNFRPGRPAEPASLLSKQVMTAVTGKLDQWFVGVTTLFRITQCCAI